jgi:hypothetical protein
MKKTMLLSAVAAMLMCIGIQSCKKEGPAGPEGATGGVGPAGPVGPVENAPKAPIDRFSSTNAPMGKMFIRTSANGLPGKNAPIDFDNNPMFYSKCLGPNGEKVLYYHFDVMPIATIPVYVFQSQR